MVAFGRRSNQQDDMHLSLLTASSSSPEFHRAETCALKVFGSSYGYALMNFNSDARSSSRFCKHPKVNQMTSRQPKHRTFDHNIVPEWESR